MNTWVLIIIGTALMGMSPDTTHPAMMRVSHIRDMGECQSALKTTVQALHENLGRTIHVSSARCTKE